MNGVGKKLRIDGSIRTGRFENMDFKRFIGKKCMIQIAGPWYCATATKEGNVTALQLKGPDGDQFLVVPFIIGEVLEDESIRFLDKSSNSFIDVLINPAHVVSVAALSDVKPEPISRLIVSPSLS